MLQVRRPLRYKFLLLTTALLVGSVFVHVWLATQIFREDKTALVFELNRSLVSGVRNEIQHKTETVFEKMTAWAILWHERGVDGLRSLVQEESDVIAILRPLPDGAFEFLFQNAKYFETYGKEVRDFEVEVAGLLSGANRQQDRVLLPIEVKGLPRILSLQRIIIEEDSSGRRVRQTPLLALIAMDSLQQVSKSSRLTQIQVVDQEGRSLLEPSDLKVKSGLESLSKSAASSPSETMVLTVQDSQGQSYLGAFSRSPQFTALAVTSQVEVFRVVDQLVRRSVLFGSIVVSVAFLLILIFSKTITRPLEALMLGMERVRQGDYGSQISVKADDEIAILSDSFNRMIQEVQGSQAALEEANRGLEAKVAERTRQLEEQNRAVKEAQEALLRTTRLASVGEIAGRAAHEVLNPLTGILARLEKIQRRLTGQTAKEVSLLTEIQSAWRKDFEQGGWNQLAKNLQAPSQVQPGKSLAEEDLENLSVISASLGEEQKTLMEDAKFLISESQRINRIVSQMRGLSHVKRELKVESVHRLLEESRNVMADLFDRDGIKVELEFLAKDDLVLLNRDEFLQMMTNMIRNSLHAIHAREVSQGILVLRTHSEGSNILVDVVDNGIGIQQDEKAQLFKNQFTTKDPSVGTGMGLSISRRFARGFNGELELLKSDYGSGTVFRITLPVAAGADQKGYGT